RARGRWSASPRAGTARPESAGSSSARSRPRRCAGSTSTSSSASTPTSATSGPREPMTPPSPAPEPLTVLEALHSTPARRYLAPDPIPDDVLWEILDAAIRGPSGGNTQYWGWVVVTDQDVKDRVAAWYRDNWEAAYGARREEILNPAAESPRGLTPRGFLGAEHLAHHLHEAPVWVFAVLRGAAGATSPRVGSSIYGAVQQLCLAARAYGIGTSLTTLYGGHEDELRELL